MSIFLVHKVWRYVFACITCNALKDRNMILSSRSESFSKTVFVIIKFFKSYHKTYWKIILFCVIFVIFNMTKITQNRWYAKSPSVPFVARQRTLTLIASKICMSHIIIWNLFLLHTSEDFLSTYYSNLTFLKAAKSGGKDSHDFNTEGFSKTFKFIWDHF